MSFREVDRGRSTGGRIAVARPKPAWRRSTLDAGAPHNSVSPSLLNYQSQASLALFIDVLVVIATSVLSGTGYHQIALGVQGNVGDFVATGLVAAIIFCGLSRLIESNHPLKTSNMWERARGSALAWLLTVLLFVFSTFTLKVGEDLSRGAVLTFFVVGMASIVISRTRTPVLLAKARTAVAFARSDAILVGCQGNTMLHSLAELIHRATRSYPSVVMFDAECDSERWPFERKEMLMSVVQLTQSLRTAEIYVAASDVPADRLDSVLRSLSLLPRPVLLVPDTSTAALLRYPITAVGEAVAVEVQREPLNVAQRVVKRATDLVLASVALVVFSPFLAVVAVAIKCDSRGPVLFRQMRNGYQGRPFRILKFRTMTVMEDGETVTQAGRHDPRVTRVGRWLRRNSIDELPQLINVIRGEMSLVGPRPHARAHDDHYRTVIENYEVRQQVKPGMTGWAQVHGLRGETAQVSSMYERIEHDLWYAKHCTLLLDLQILVRTIFVVALRQGAY